ncbi:MAG TPA: PD-(D/E)XK nuclease family protein [Candidatus Binatia bacterium]|nr:PD-(D/E)XK nuclease family protein [Candidatus Binatia bacterium]
MVVGAEAGARLASATAWLDAVPADAEALLVGPSWEAVDELARAVGAPRFGLHRATLDRLAGRLAAPGLARRGLATATGLSLAAVVARAVHALVAADALPYFRPVATRPGFAGAIARTIGELRMNGVTPPALARAGRGGADLARVAERVAAELASAGIADRALVFEAAVDAVAAAAPPVGTPLLLLDVPVTSAREASLVAALAARAPAVLATAPAGDARTLAALERALGVGAETVRPPDRGGSLAALQTHLFESSAPAPAPLDEGVTLASWPGEARECVEIARAILAEARRGVPFDRMAVFLHAPGAYTAHLEEAFDRARIPAFFARGTRRPHPAGRALLALLACAAEGLSARRFAEYLSLAQVPEPAAARDGWAPPADDLVAPLPLAPAADAPRVDPPCHPDARATTDGTLRAPWRWERLIVDAAVIGGPRRWAERLAHLGADLERRREAALADEDEARAAFFARQRADLAHLAAFALPLVERLAALPAAARWGAWLEHLRALADAALREPEPVLATLAELAPMAPVGPVELDEVRLVLDPRLRDLAVPPARRRYGAVLVAPTTAARGLAFDVVFVPGLAEKLFPGKIVEDPILPDAARAALDAPLLTTQDTKVAGERLALRLPVGAARRRVVLSYPRLDVEQARRRVPSFYGLEALRAAEGTLAGFDELAARAEEAAGGRLGWPAPDDAAQAVDEAEYDLALLAPLVGADPATTIGTAHYLLTANPHLGRALRARARRWIARWTPADGLVDPDDAARAALARHGLAARSFSPTALQHFAACPYRFLLQAVHRLAPREEPVALETLDPLTRGSLVHEAQFATLTALRDRGLLPLAPAREAEALALLDAVLDEVATRFADEHAPAIPRVWDDAVAGIRADLREWLRREARASGGWAPWRFELAFGLPRGERGQADPTSIRDAVVVEGGLRLRGSIDLVERHPSGVLRATDHKTGKARTRPGVVIGGGEVLQPLLYALACERLLDEPVESGRLYYCTADGGYAERVVPLDDAARAAVRAVVATVGTALAEGFLPAAPREGACAWCDYRPVCGPYEEQRVRVKPPGRLAALARLREMP